MAVTIEQLSGLIQDRWKLRSMGGGVARVVVDERRNLHLYKTKNWIIQLGKDRRIRMDSEQRWEREAVRYSDHVKHEALNTDLKSVDAYAPTTDDVKEYVEELGLEGMVSVIGGCPSRPDDERLSKMITLAANNERGSASTIHISPVLGEKDRRYSKQPERLNMFQYFAVTPDHKIVNTVTGAEIARTDLRDALPDYFNNKVDKSNLIIFLGRYLLNLVRGFKFINTRGETDEWISDIEIKEAQDMLVFASSIPDDIKRGEIDQSTINEFRYTAMSAFLLNPQLFSNLVVYLDLHSVFHLFGDVVMQNKVYASPRFPKSKNELTEDIVMIIGEYFDGDMSVLANVARMFGISQFRGINEYTY